MPKIRVLPDEVANRIAAGEIIERPASVVKECVENSIDAGSTEIKVSLISGGRDFIQIIDNGHGMSEDDAFLAFERHATSKIRSVDDITHITTMGFRGEALPSIASVSKFQLITKTASDDMATELNFSGGKLDLMQKTASNNGTTITIKNIFYNVPARRKFLKSEQVEYKHILNYLHYQSVLFPQIRFILYHNNKEKFNYPATTSLENRMLDVFGTLFIKQNFIRLDEPNETVSDNNTEEQPVSHITLSGYLQDIDQPEQNNILDVHYLFVNRRFIYDKVVYSAIKNAYDPYLKKYRFFGGGKLPNYILFIDINPEEIDVNVHPAKTEIRFKNTGAIYQFVKDKIYKALHDRESKRYADTRNRVSSVPLTSPLSPIEQIMASDIFSGRKRGEERRPTAEEEQDILIRMQTLGKKTTTASYTQTVPIAENVKDIVKIIPQSMFSIPNITDDLWQLHNTYIFIQAEDGFVVIDQHAAHERIIYEKMLKNIDNKKPNKQKLVFPLVIDLPKIFSDKIKDVIEENIEMLDSMGFTIKSFSGNSVVIDDIPAEIDYWDGGNIFIEILQQLQDELSQTTDFRIASAASVACKASIKAGKKLTKREMHELITDLFTCDLPFQCPHGRPLIFKMTLTDIEKMFKRII
jgi:DNA mismatch repair protein MutL